MAAPEIIIHTNQAPRQVPHDGLQVREDVAYTNHKGNEKKAIRKRAEKALAKLREPLGRILQPEETVLYVARVQAPASVWEQLGFGWYIYYVTGTVVVLTNRRLLHFLVTRDGSWKKALRAVHWGDVAEARVKGLLSPTLELKYRNGKKETYWGLRRDDAKKFKLLAEKLLPESTADVSPAQAMAPLCPTCLAALTPKVYQCGQCHLAFKDEGSLVRRSLLIPGGGYFYTGHTFLGVMDFIVEAYLLILFLGLLVVALLEPGAAETWIALAVIGGLLAVEKFFTIHHARRFVRDFIPSEGGVQPLGKTAVVLMAAFLALVVGIVWWGWSLTAEPVKVVEAQLDALRQDDYARAYAYLSKPLQAQLSPDAFQQFVEGNPAVMKPVKASFPDRDLTNNRATICGTLTGQGGETTYACFMLVQEGEEWVIDGLQFGEQP